MSTIYTSGPIAGHDDLNLGAFDSAAASLRDRGDHAIIPHDIEPYSHEGPCLAVYSNSDGGTHDGGCHLRGDIGPMLSADSLYLLPGWSKSRGCQIEVLIARLFAMPVEYAPDAEQGGSAVETLAAVYAEIGRQDEQWGVQDACRARVTREAS